jgi:hypothetical protein
MSHVQFTSPEFSARLAELATLFIACRDAFHETADAYRWAPAQHSPAWADAAELPSPDPLLADPEGESGHRLIAEVVQTFLLTASGHLGGLASLYSSAEILFSPALLTRAVIENCAHAVWVLGDDPEEPAENRLARCYLEELLSAEEAKKNFGRMHGKSHPSYLKYASEYKHLKEQLLVRFPEETKQTLGERTINGQELPGLELVVKWMYSLTEAAGGTINQDVASGIYGALSNRTHPTLYPARARRVWPSTTDDGYAVAQLEVELSAVENEARAALAAFYNALTYTNSYFGWPTTILDALESEMEKVIPTFFR